jgi:hypothetical protein
MKRTVFLVIALLLGLAGSVHAQDDKPFTDGPVVAISYIKVKPGHFTEYMKYLDGPYKAVMEAQKKAGLITGYKVFENQARSPHDADLILSVTYPNMAALDRSDEADAVSAKVMGSRTQQDKAFGERGAMREVLGGQLIRELILK